MQPPTEIGTIVVVDGVEFELTGVPPPVIGPKGCGLTRFWKTACIGCSRVWKLMIDGDRMPAPSACVKCQAILDQVHGRKKGGKAVRKKPVR